MLVTMDIFVILRDLYFEVKGLQKRMVGFSSLIEDKPVNMN
jgi:hypothetical protein